MKWLLSAMCLCLVIPTAAYADLIANPSAEQAGADPSQPAFWSPDQWGDAKATFIWKEGGYHGNKCLRVDLLATKIGDAKWWSDSAKLTGQKKIEVRNRYRSDVETRLLVRFSNSNGKNAFVNVANLPASASWTEASGSMTVPSWASHVRVMQTIKAIGWVETDAWFAGEVFGDPPKYPEKGTKPKVSLSFDDGWLSAYELLVPLLNERGLRGTHFVVSDFIGTKITDGAGKSAGYMAAEQLIALLKSKHELGGHGFDHKDHEQMPYTQLLANLTLIKDKLTGLGTDVAGYATPFGSYNEGIVELIDKHYAYHRTLTSGVNTKPYKPLELLAVEVDEQMTLLEFSEWVVKAAEQDAWVIFVYQRAALEPTDGAFVRPNLFEAQLDYLLKVDADVRPIGEMLNAWKPKPVVVVKPDIVKGQRLPELDAVSKDPNYKPPMREVDGCSATPTRTAAKTQDSRTWSGLLLLAMGFLWGRRRVASTPS